MSILFDQLHSQPEICHCEVMCVPGVPVLYLSLSEWGMSSDIDMHDESCEHMEFMVTFENGFATVILVWKVTQLHHEVLSYRITSTIFLEKV